MILKQGTLWDQLSRVTERAIAAGALLPVPTEYSFIEDSGIRFLVRVLAGLAQKHDAWKKQIAASETGKTTNPFLPPEKELTVADISDTHVAVLNKFNVVRHHLLIITRQFEDQESLLTPADFEAFCLCMAEFNGLGFYNGGRAGGASQRHKHLQIIPLPLAPAGPAIPVEPLFPQTPPYELSTVPVFSFLHSFVRLDRRLALSPVEAAKKIFSLYNIMLSSVGMTISSADSPVRQSMPYCFLATRDWMLLVPRSRESFGDISLNSLAYAGSLFVQSEHVLETLKSCGPLNALRSVAMPK